jgi:acyl-CoA synthetase (AMP-forming)/AMP-acid ligase II
MKSVGITSSYDQVPTNASNLTYSPESSDVALLLSTHGTTGPKKVVPLTHGQIFDGLDGISKALLLEPSDSTILVATLTQSHGLIGVLLASFYRGSNAHL